MIFYFHEAFNFFMQNLAFSKECECFFHWLDKSSRKLWKPEKRKKCAARACTNKETTQWFVVICCHEQEHEGSVPLCWSFSFKRSWVSLVSVQEKAVLKLPIINYCAANHMIFKKNSIYFTRAPCYSLFVIMFMLFMFMYKDKLS